MIFKKCPIASEADFMLMVKQYEPIIYKVCNLFARRNPEVVRDLYQDVVCALWQSRRRFRGESSLQTWIYRVALNTVVNHHRRRVKDDVVGPLDEQTLEDQPARGFDELVDRLYDLIQRLSPKDQKLVYLYIDGLSTEEIAATLGITPSAAGVRIHRIKQALKQLNRHDPEQ